MPAILTQPQRFVLPSSGRLVNPACPVNWAHPLNAGRILWWSIVGNPGWRGSNVFHDLVRGAGHNPNDGTFQSIGSGSFPRWMGSLGQPGSIGCLKMTGTSTSVGAYVSCANVSNIISSLSSISIAIWANLPASVSWNQSLVGMRNEIAPSNSDGPGAFYINLLTSGVYETRFRNGSGTAVTVPNYSFNSGWKRLIATYDGTTLSLFVNGSLAVSAAASLGTFGQNGVPFSIGRTGGISSNNLQGMPSVSATDAALWSRALSAQDVALDYQLSRQGYPNVLNYLGTTEYSFPTESNAGNFFLCMG